MTKQLKFFYVASEKISEEALKTRFTSRLLETQREVHSAEIAAYVAVTWNLVTFGLRPVPAFCISEPDSQTMFRIVKRDISRFATEAFGPNADELLDRVRNDLLIALSLNPGRARRLFDVETNSFSSFARGTFGFSIRAKHHVDTTLVTLCSDQVGTFLLKNSVAKALGYSVQKITCDGALPLAKRLRESINRVTGPFSKTPSWQPPAHPHHYQEEATSSVHAISGGQFESKRRKF